MTRMGRDALLVTMRVVRMTIRWMTKYQRKEVAKIVGSEDLRGCWHIKGGVVEIKMRSYWARDLGKEGMVMTLLLRT